MKGSSLQLSDLLRYAESEVTASEAQEIEEQLNRNAAASEQLDRIQEIVAAVAQPDRELAEIDLVDRVHQGIETLPAASRPQRRSRARIAAFTTAAGLAAAAALTLVLVWPGLDSAPTESEQFRPKAAGPAAAGRERWVGLKAFEATGAAQPSPLDEELARQSGLLFSYTNLGPKPYRYLAVFAVDRAGQVYWYFPAFLSAAENPLSIPIEQGVADAELAEIVRHDFNPGPLAIYGAFSDQVLSVSEIEALVSGEVAAGRLDVSSPAELPLRGAAQQIMKVEIR
jgi:hypothetical protein